MISIFILAHNEANLAKISVEAVRESVGEQEVSVILIDNGSMDDLAAWASEQPDITYVATEEGMDPWGSVLNQAIEALEVDTDILVMQSRFVLMPGNLERLEKHLHESAEIGMVSCVTSSAITPAQRPSEPINDIDRVYAYSVVHKDDLPVEIMKPECGIFFLRKEALNSLADFMMRYGRCMR